MVQRNMPQGIGHILGDMFREAGAQVLYSADRDNDDTLAFFAHADGADVLRCHLLQPSPAFFCFSSLTCACSAPSSVALAALWLRSG